MSQEAEHAHVSTGDTIDEKSAEPGRPAFAICAVKAETTLGLGVVPSHVAP